MSRILIALSIVLLIVSGYFIYSQNLLSQMLNPTVMSYVANKDINEGNNLSLSNFTARRISVGDVPSGMVVFSLNAPQDEIKDVFKDKVTHRAIKEGDILMADDFGTKEDVFQVRVLSNIEAGQEIEVDDLGTVAVTNPVAGRFVFLTEEEAEAFKEQIGGNARASREIPLASFIGARDFSSGGGGGALYVLQTTRSLAEETPLSPSDLESILMSSENIPRGVIAFPSAQAAEIFVATADNLALSTTVSEGTTVTTEMIKFGSSRVLRDFNIEDNLRPETFLELVELQSEMPLDVKFINLGVNFPDLDVQAYVPLIGAKPVEGETMDMWVEVSRTEGPFGSIHLKRFREGIEINKVVDPELVLAERERRQEEQETEVSGATPPVDPNDVITASAKGVFYWANVTRGGGLAIEEAREDGRIIFMLSSKTPVSDFMGNGVSCRDDFCMVSNSVSEDLKIVRAAIDEINGQAPEDEAEDGPALDPFYILDGVTVELQDQMHASGYETFEQLAVMSSGDVTAMALDLNIPSDLATYIRLQSVEVVNMARRAQNEMGINGAPE